MGKRSNFERIPRDFYPTPYAAVVPLLPHLAPNTAFVEPCAGDGALMHHLEKHRHECVGAWDIEPRHPFVAIADARYKHAAGSKIGTVRITNPPWRRDVLHALITHLSSFGPTWLLFDADWMHTRQAAPFMPFLRKIVSVGRVKWIEDSPFTGKDNCCWYLFDQTSKSLAQFIGRAA